MFLDQGTEQKMSSLPFLLPARIGNGRHFGGHYDDEGSNKAYNPNLLFLLLPSV